MFFLSGAFFPIDNLPAYLEPFVHLNPITYSVDGIRAALIGRSAFPITFDFAVISVFSVAMVVAGIQAFKKMKV